MGPPCFNSGRGLGSQKGLIISVLLGIYFRILRLGYVENQFTFSGKPYESDFIATGLACDYFNFISINLSLFDIIKTNLVNSIILVKVQPGIGISLMSFNYSFFTV